MIRQIFDYFRMRKLRVHILTIFLSLIFFSLAFIISYTYSQNSKTILDFSIGSIKRNASLIIEKVTCLIWDTQRLPEIGAQLFSIYPEITLENEEVRFFLMSAVKTQQYLYSYQVGTRNGTYIAALDLNVAKMTHYISDPSKPLPEGSQYAFHLVDGSQDPPVESWIYKNNQLETVGSEILPKAVFDPRARPWYVKIEKTHAVIGTEIFPLYPSKEPGITVAAPILNEANEVTAAVAIHLSLESFSQFLEKQKIGKTGRAIVMETNGQVIFPQQNTLNASSSSISPQVISSAFNEYKIKKEDDFILDIPEGKYLVSIQQFPLIAEQDWLMVIIVPFTDFFDDFLTTQQKVLLFSLLILGLSAALVILLSKRISSPIVKLAEAVTKIKQLDFSDDTRVTSNIQEIHLMDEAIASMRAGLRSFGRYIPKEIVKGLIDKGQEIALGGKKQEIVVFFSDIAGFTSMAEMLTTEDLMSLLSEYFDRLSKIIILNEGTIDKYIGDSIMALWGAPNEVLDPCAQACLSALLCRCEGEELSRDWAKENKPILFTRFGIHSGTAIVGNIGTNDRMNYTAIGDTVNIAARLEGVNKEYHTSIVISEEVYRALKGRFLCRPLDVVALKGKKAKLKVYELVAMLEGNEKLLPKPHELELCQMFTEAFEAFSIGQLPDARKLFKDIHNRFPEDFPTQLYLHRLTQLTT